MPHLRRLAIVAIALAGLVLAQPGLAETSDQVRDAQNMLTRLGLYFGPVDGHLDPATTASFTTWLFSHRLPARTPLNVTTLKLMARDLGEDEPPPKPPPRATAKSGSEVPWYVLLALSLLAPL
jgi:putative peptidoglycan binding protein